MNQTLQNRKKLKPFNPFGLAIVLSPFLLLDFVELMSRYYAPESLSRYSCDAIPFFKPIAGFAFDQLMSSAILQCKKNTIEPMASIVFFFLKVDLAIVGAVLITIRTYIIPTNLVPFSLQAGYRRARKARRDSVVRYDGIVGQVENQLPTLLGMIAFCGYFCYLFDVPTKSLNLTINGKLGEDFATLLLFICIVGILGELMTIVEYSVLTLRYGASYYSLTAINNENKDL